MIERLPNEIISEIVCDLDQHDLLSLGLVNKRLHHCTLPRLYRAITIDSTKKVYMNRNIIRNASIPSACNEVSYYKPVKAVVVRSIYCLKVFLRNLQRNRDHCRFVNVLEFASSIPDMPEMELVDALSDLIPHLVNLKTFNWFNTDFSYNLDSVNSVDNFKNLVELNGNFKVEWNTLSSIPEKNIKSLHLSAFNLAENLKVLDLRKFDNLKDLVISKSVSDSKKFEHYKNDGSSLNYDFEEATYISNLFMNKFVPGKLQLSRLVLKDMTLHASDAKTLLENVDFTCLKELSIINCVELLFDTILEQNNIIRRTPPTAFFLKYLQPHMRALQVLNLDLSNELNYNNKTLNFLDGIPSALKKLNLNVKFNRFESLSSNLFNVINSMKKHKETLHLLNFNFDVLAGGSTSFSQKSCNLDFKVSSLEQLSCFQELRYLRVPLSQYQMANLLGILHPLKKLQCLKLSMLNETDNSINNNSSESSLINKDFFDYSCAMMKYSCCCQLRNYVFDFICVLDSLKWVMFENGRLDSYVFESAGNTVHLRDSYEMYFNHIVDDLI